MADSLIGSVVDGVYSKTQASQDATKAANTNISTSKTDEQKNGGYTEDMFLQLLVAEMQYQDPLEPTDNSQYVAQLASFTQIEAIQAVQADMKSIQGNSMVGKMVALVDENEEIHGRVDYVRTDDDGELVASVNGKEYSTDKIKTIMDESYYNAILTADTIMTEIAKLPNPNLLNLGDQKNVENVTQMLASIDNYTFGFIDKDAVDYYKSVLKRMNEIIEENKKNTEEAAKTEETEKTTEEAAETVQTTNTSNNENTENTQSNEENTEVAEEVNG